MADQSEEILTKQEFYDEDKTHLKAEYQYVVKKYGYWQTADEYEMPEYDDFGSRRVFEEITDEFLCGTYRSYWENGHIKAEGTYEINPEFPFNPEPEDNFRTSKSVKTGTWSYYNQDGVLEKREKFGDKYEIETFWPNGNLQSRENLKGEKEQYWPNGNLKRKETKEGDAEFYWPNGNLKRKETKEGEIFQYYQDGSEEKAVRKNWKGFHYTENYPDGTLKEEGYLEGSLERWSSEEKWVYSPKGLWTSYASDKQTNRLLDFDNRTFIEFREDGSLLSQGKMCGVSLSKEDFLNKEIIKLKKNDCCFIYDKGRVVAIERYKRGELDGSQMYFDKEGNRLQDVVYRNGKKTEESPVSQEKEKNDSEGSLSTEVLKILMNKTK